MPGPPRKEAKAIIGRFLAQMSEWPDAVYNVQIQQDNGHWTTKSDGGNTSRVIMASELLDTIIEHEGKGSKWVPRVYDDDEDT